MKHPSDQPVLASAQRSEGSGYSNYVKISNYEIAMVGLDITAISGAPTLDISLQTCPDPTVAEPKWYTVYREDQITAAEMATLPARFMGQPQKGFINYVRIAYAVSGATTPKVTFSANIFSK